MELSSKRAQTLSLTGLIISVVFFLATWIIWSMSVAYAVHELAWLILANAAIWFILVIQFHQRVLAEREKLDMAQLARARQGGTIFQEERDPAAALAVASRRLKLIETWFVPIGGVVVAVYEIAMGGYLCTKVRLGLLEQAESLQQPQLAAVFMVAIAFVSFLISRYGIGMSRERVWRPLRAGATHLFGITLLAFVAAITLALSQFKIMVGLQILAWVVPILMIVLGVETVLNAILDLYRPRVPGAYDRAAFDSRLLGLFGEPGGILHTVASTIDYQFGFKVSQTWFYRLLEQAVLPLFLFAVGVLYLLSCFVVVGPGEGAVVEHLGRPVQQADGSYVLGPGMHVKWPWPIDRAFKHPTARIQQVNIGFVEDPTKASEPLLWGRQHYKEEFDILVAAEMEADAESTDTPPVSIIRAAVPVHYRVKDLYRFLYGFSDWRNPFAEDRRSHAEKMVEAICYRELVQFAASAKVETEGDLEGRSVRLSILGMGRKAAADELKRRMQATADRMGLGIEIVLVNLQGIHPPPKLADAYQSVIAAVQEKQAAVLAAQAERNRLLTELAGSLKQTEALLELGRRSQGDAAQDERAFAKLLQAAGGEAYQALRDAQAYRFQRVTLAEAIAKQFGDQAFAYDRAPSIFPHLQRLNVLEESTTKSRKYVVVADEAKQRVFIVNLEEKLSGILDMDLLEQEGKK